MIIDFSRGQVKFYFAKRLREPGLEPGSRRWQRHIVPLDHSRISESPPHEHVDKALLLISSRPLIYRRAHALQNEMQTKVGKETR